MPVPTPTPATLGQAVRAARHDKGLTIEALADAAGVHPTYLSDIERGRGNPSVGKLAAIASALDVRASTLLAAAEGDE